MNFLAWPDIEKLQRDADYAFDEVPMPYDITINAKGAGTKDVEYTVIPARHSVQLSHAKRALMAGTKSIRELQEALFRCVSRWEECRAKVRYRIAFDEVSMSTVRRRECVDRPCRYSARARCHGCGLGMSLVPAPVDREIRAPYSCQSFHVIAPASSGGASRAISSAVLFPCESNPGSLEAAGAAARASLLFGRFAVGRDHLHVVEHVLDAVIHASGDLISRFDPGVHVIFVRLVHHRH